MKTTVKQMKLLVIIFLVLAGMIIGYNLTKQLWGWGKPEPLSALLAVIPAIFSILISINLKKKKDEENKNKTNP